MIKALLVLLLLLGTYGCSSERARVSPRPCRASQLRVSQGRTAVGLGNRLEELVFTNVGTRPCLLRGYPTITAETPAGRRVVQARRGGTYFGRLVPAVLRPGGRGFLDFGTSNDTECPIRPIVIVRYHDLVFTLPQGGRVRGERVSITENCSLSISALGRPEPPG